MEANVVVNGTRLYEPIRSLCLVFDAFNFATCALHRSEVPPPEREANGAIMSGHLARAKLVVTSGSTFRSALFGHAEPPVWVKLTNVDADEARKADTGPGIEGPLSGLIQFFNDAAAIQFVMFYERYIHWVKSRARHDFGRLEPTWAFGKVVRNAIGHAGTVRIDDKNFEPVSWEGLTYGPDQNGRKIIGPDFHAPDLVLLMLDLDRALELMGYDQPLP